MVRCGIGFQRVNATLEKAKPPYSLGLGGDGDEIDVVQDVEDAFSVTLNTDDAHSWKTVGDVYAALLKALGKADDKKIWALFVKAVSEETGVEAGKVTKDTLLLSEAYLLDSIREATKSLWRKGRRRLKRN